jgi:ATP-binding cassette subfamily F protein uup
MGILVSCQSISKSYSSRALFTGISFGIEEGQKIGLIGPNGAGKSTLLKIIASMVEPDAGSVVSRRLLRVAYVPQVETFELEKTIFQLVRDSALEVPFEDYEREASIDSTLAKFKFPDREAEVQAISGGWRKKLALACALVQQPELLLMDEPTNHLDLQSVLWLESLLRGTNIAFILVSHDRAFLEEVTNRTIELNPTYPQGFISVNGPYSDFLAAKQEQLTAQQNLEQSLASKVRREIAWLQRGARARQTKSRGRIKDAGKLIEEFGEVKTRNALSNAQIEVGFDASGRKTKELLVAKGISKSFSSQKLISNLSLLLTSNFKLGLVGRNGSGKTTLLKMIVGDAEPDAGTIKRADGLKIVWFDQNRAQLDQTKTLRESLCPIGDTVNYRGRSLHVATWAQKFLFRTDQLNIQISYLSGGEQARILLANLMTKQADILILDEPTNDLDIPSLEVLEDSLVDFPGAVVLVTHDRMMLDTVSQQILALDGRGSASFFADYQQFSDNADQFIADPGEKSKAEIKAAARAAKARNGLSTAEKQELTTISEKIAEAEKVVATLQREMEDPRNASNYPKLQDLMSKRDEARQHVDAIFARWQALEARASQ